MAQPTLRKTPCIACLFEADRGNSFKPDIFEYMKPELCILRILLTNSNVNYDLTLLHDFSYTDFK